MTAAVFTTNESEYSRLEGLYVREVNPPAQISGVSLNVVGMAAETVRGPTDHTVEITSEQRFVEVFGGRDYGSGGAIINKGWQALLNKQFGKVVVARAAASDAVAASFTLESLGGGTGTALLQVDASSVGAWGNNVYISVTDASDGDAEHFNLKVKYLGNVTTYKNLDIYDSTDDNTLTVLGDDDGNIVTLTKLSSGRPLNTANYVTGPDADGYVYLGQTIDGFTSVVGTQGTIADSDFTATGGPLELLAVESGVGVVFIAERSSTALKTKMNTLAGASSDRMFIIGPDSVSTTAAAAITEVDSYRSDRLIYAFNAPYTLDPDTATLLQVYPESWMASILSQTDVDIHPGEEDTKKYTAGISKLTNQSFTREDYISLKEAGICALEKDDGFAFVSGVTTSLTPGYEQITRRRSADWLLLSIARTLKYSVKKKNTETRRKANASMIQSFLRDSMRNERVVEDFTVDTEKLNTAAQRALGIEKILMRVKLLGHMLHLVLEAEIGTAVNLTEVAG